VFSKALNLELATSFQRKKMELLPAYFLNPLGQRFLQSTSRETHIKRQVTQHGCLSSMLGDGDRVIEIIEIL
jgi:hypothetical protein